MTKRAEEMGRVLEEWKRSGQTRQAFCASRTMPLTTFDYWRRELAGKTKPKLVRVEIAREEPGTHFTLSLRNGRKIESLWRCGEAELTRLIRIAESA